MFFCDRCLEVGPATICICEVCSQPNGALKKVQEKWVHVTCAVSEGLVNDWATMNIENFVRKKAKEMCYLCKSQSFGCVQCGDCEKKAHLICILRESTLNITDYLVNHEFFCDAHMENHEKYCFCRKLYVEGESFMIACDACDIWYHGECVKISSVLGANIEHYLCKFCDAWSNIKSRLEKEDLTGKFGPFEPPLTFTNFKLKDWLIFTRAVYRRTCESLDNKVKIEELTEILNVIETLPFVFNQTADLKVKIENGKKLIEKDREICLMLKEPPDEELVPVLQNFVNEGKKSGVFLPGTAKIAKYIENCQSISQIREVLENSKIFTLLQVRTLYENMLKRFAKELDSMVELKNLIGTCENWLSEVKEELRSSQAKPLGQKLDISDIKKYLQKAKNLPFSMQTEARIVEDEIKSAEDWDKKYKQFPRPIDSIEFQMLLQETEGLALETQHMRVALNKFEEFQEWVKKTEAIISPSANAVLPNLEQVKAHLFLGESEIEPFVEIKEMKAKFIGKIQEAEVWQTDAINAILKKVPPQKLTALVRDAKSIICQFGELEVIEKRASVNKKIGEIIHKRHKEDELLSLMVEANECNADEEFIQALQVRIHSVQELKTKVKEALNVPITDPLNAYSKLLEDLKNSKVDLVEERNQIEEKIKSLKWLQQVKETLQELDEGRDEDFRKKKKSDLEIIKNLVQKGEKIAYRDIQADEMLQELTLKLWEIEYQRFHQCDEITLEQVKELESRANTLSSTPSSLSAFQDLLNEINQAISFYENLLTEEIGKTMQSDLEKLKRDIEFYKEKLESFGMVFPEKYSKILNWDKWIDWCLNAEKLFVMKPSIDKLYEANQDALSLSIPSTVPCLVQLNKVILEYEQWLYKYTSYSSARKWFSVQNFDIKHYLKKANERPKPTLKQLKELLDTAVLLNINCEYEIQVMQGDIDGLEKWISKQEEFFQKEKYEELLQKCKKSYETFISLPACQEFYEIVKEYCFKIYIEHEDFGKKLCSYEWNISGQRLLQVKGKISLEEWNDFFMSIEYLHKDFLDQATLDRLRVQNALRIQIENEMKKVKNLESLGQESEQVNIEVLEILSKQISVCKIVLTNEEAYVKSTLSKCKNLSTRLTELISQKAFLQDFKSLQAEILNLPVLIPETSAKLKEILERSATLSLRGRILREHAMKNKIEKSKVEQFLHDYESSDVRLEDGETLLGELTYAKKVLEEAVNSVYSEGSSLDQLNCVSGKLNNMKIFMGLEEKEIKIKMWKRKLQLSQNEKVNYSIILGWYNEGLQMKDYSMQEDLDRLELYVKKGEELKQKLLECSSLEEIKSIENEAEQLPFDLSHAVIEHKTRISIGKAPKELVPVEVPTAGFIEGIENRYSSQKLIEAALTKDPYFTWAKHPQKAVKISQRIEEILYNNLQGNGYKNAVNNMQTIIISLQEYGGFSKKLTQGEITPEEISLLSTSEVNLPKVIQRIFDGNPSINITIHRSLLRLDRNEPELVKKKKVAKVEKIHTKKEISNLKTMIKSIKPVVPQAKPEVKSQIQPTPVSGFSVAGLLNEVQAFHKKAEESKKLIKREEPKDPIIVSEKYRSQVDLSTSKVNPADEWKELSKLRLERSGLITDDALFDKKADDLPIRRKRNDEYYEEGKFSSDEDENDPEGEAGHEEYNLMELAQKTEFQRRKHRKKAKLYDPFPSATPKNKALPGSLLKVWNGIMEYGKHSIKVDMFSVESIELFQKIPKLTSKLSVHGRTKQNELEVYISQNSSGLASRSIVTSWIEPIEPNEKHFMELVHDLKEKSRAAVIRIDNTLTIYLSAITDSFISFLNSLRININQRLDKSVAPNVTENEKLACLIFFKKSQGSSSNLMDPEVIAHIDPSRVHEQEEDDLPEKEDMSPITSGDDEDGEKQDDLPKVLQEALTALSSGANYTEILGNLKQAMESLKASSSSQDLSPNNNEINNLISVIRMQVEQEAQKQPQNNPQNVNQFLSQQFVQRPSPSPYMYMPQGMMYPPQPIYPNAYFPAQGRGQHPGHMSHHPGHMGYPNNIPHPGYTGYPGNMGHMGHPGNPAHMPNPNNPNNPGHPQNTASYRPPTPERKYDDPRRNTRY